MITLVNGILVTPNRKDLPECPLQTLALLVVLQFTAKFGVIFILIIF